MTQEPRVYISLEDDAGQLIIKGPLSLFDRLIVTLAARRAAGPDLAIPAQEAQP